jgi:PAS domain S-box-containing protein
MWKKTLSFKIVFVSLIIIVFVITLITGSYYTSSKNMLLSLEHSTLKMYAVTGADYVSLLLKEDLPPVEKYEMIKGYTTAELYKERGLFGYAFIIDLDGNILFHPEHEGKNIYDLGFLFIEEMIQKKSGTLHYTYRDKPKTVYYTPIDGTNMIYAVGGNDIDFLNPASDLLKQLIRIGFSASTIALILYMILVSGILRPVASLVKKLKAAGEGKYEELQIFRDDPAEMQVLAKAYNSMIKSLEDNNKLLHQEKQFAERVLTSIGEGVYIATPEREIVLWSNGAEKITGFLSKDVIGKRCYEILQSLDINGERMCKTYNCTMENCLKNKNSIIKEETLLLSKNGERIPVHITGSPIYSEEEEFKGIVVVFRDISEEKRTIETIKQASKAKSEFLATMSHELRTPLNTIIGFSDIIREQHYGPLNEKQKRYIENIYQSGNLLLTLINDVLDLSKVEAGKMEWKTQHIDIKTLIHNKVLLLKERAYEGKLNLNYEILSNKRLVYGDEIKIKQILFNLLSNAIKFTPEGGSIGIIVKDSVIYKGYIDFEIWDTGIGIPEDKFEDIFQPFVQLDSTISRKFSGTGLGLNLVRKFLDLGKGYISVSSKVGKGSKFTFSLPSEAN